MIVRQFFILNLSVLFGFLIACSDDISDQEPCFDRADLLTDASVSAPDNALDAAQSDVGTAQLSVAVKGMSVTELPSNMLARWVDFSTTYKVPTDVEVECGDAYEHRFQGPSTCTHQMLVTGLVADTNCELRVVADDEIIATENFDVIGPDDWPTFEVVEARPDAIQAGWNLLNLQNKYDSIPARIAIFDEEGRLRWYYQLPVSRSGGDTEVALCRDGVLACGRLREDGPFVIGWDGSVLWNAKLGGHHDCRFLDEEETVLRYLRDAEECGADQPASVVVLEVDRESGKELWRWALCKHYQPPEIVPDWSHANTIEGFPNENAFLLSSRVQHALFKVDRDTGDIVWKLGLDGDFSHKSEDAFWGQHSPEILESGNILLFDNGYKGRREYSRVIEIEYDETQMSYSVVWEYEPDPRRFNSIWGDADRLENGNTLATFGVQSKTETSDIYEIDPDGNEVWHVRLPLKWGVYRADRIPPQYGYVID